MGGGIEERLPVDSDLGYGPCIEDFPSDAIGIFKGTIFPVAM